MKCLRCIWPKLCNLIFWKRDLKRDNARPNPVELLDRTSRMLTQTVEETTQISRKLALKLESLEDQLEDREELLDIMFRTIPDFLLLKDGNGRWKMLNSYGKKIYGITGREYKGKTDQEIAEGICPRYGDNLAQCLETDEEAWNNRRATEFEEVSFDSFGRRYIFDVIKTPIFNEDGSRKYLLVHGRSITEEVENNKHISRLIKALNHASDSIAVTDHEHKIIYANDAFCKTYGYTLQEILTQPMSMVSSEHTPAYMYEDMYKHINAGEFWSGVLENKTRDGSIIKEIVSITPVLNGKPYPVYYIGVKRLIERRKHPR